MTVTKHTLTGSLADPAEGPLVDTWNTRKPVLTRAYVEMNIPKGEALVDTSTGGQVLLGHVLLALDEDDAFAVDLPSTAATSLNWSGLRYRVVVEYPNAATRSRDGWTSPWFELTADRNLRDVVEAEYAPATPVSELFASMQALRDEQVEISGLLGQDAAVAALMTTSAGPLTKAAFTAKSTPQPQALGAKTIFEVVPAAAGHAKFQVFSNSHPNYSAPGVADGTYNQSVHLGWNAGRFTGPDFTPNFQGLYMGFEDNYYDFAVGGDASYGVEWYVGYTTPDGTTIAPSYLRPLYLRVVDSDKNTSPKKVLMNIDLGGGGGSLGIGHIPTGLQHWAVQEDAGGGVPLITHFDLTWFLKGVELRPASGPASLSLKAPGVGGGGGYGEVVFRRSDGTSNWAVNGNSTEFNIMDAVNNAALVKLTPGSSTATRRMDVSGILAAAGKFGVNGATPQARASVAALPATISATYTQSEIQALKTSVQNMLVALYNVGIVA